MNKEITRCAWVTSDPEYQAYHDHEWGRPLKDSQKLFELICLEGQQAGLSWLTILKKREGYRKCFYQFDPVKIAQMDEADVEKLMKEPAIVRNRAKINAIIHNARAYLRMMEQGEDFSTFIWRFVDNTPQINHWKTRTDVPAQTATSDALSSALKKQGIKFIGSTTCYAFMQASGLVNDHLVSCLCRR
ncbi:DNA-3-methyladenine glycosylase I [Xenorhabdus szentirmaii]|uniref:DNA-3-methyladenine glycosylase I n=1 Tax=Xenorhabdus szentirmaii DSM 16338 TaxID=1427518 RepID=W1J4U2_9GAMM|nr:DNA-3-methyladenine glycosylase I [Xenorhabdus szentirmaii]PHM34650.1 DNA-3-methyladenine glycosidase [Xenorhabdus szentirmaii DSM 16338]PHM43381.1 DNA-3-methyladenine glycosidase [Xenorhabdus szentirmaii]CDL85078.1 DNA-3-methyladenine glycosylase 1 [Xenorhabdus szentirmaii DSM 16338]